MLRQLLIFAGLALVASQGYGGAPVSTGPNLAQLNQELLSACQKDDEEAVKNLILQGARHGRSIEFNLSCLACIWNSYFFASLLSLLAVSSFK